MLPLTLPAGYKAVQSRTVSDRIQTSFFRIGSISHTYCLSIQAPIRFVAPDGSEQAEIPEGTCSFAELLTRSEDTKRMVGTPTVFVSHGKMTYQSHLTGSHCEHFSTAWRYCFADVISALRNFVQSEELDEATTYFWMDTVSIDQSPTREYPQDWWLNTFRSEVKRISWTVMVLAPWNDPLPLTRSWCLWEVLATLATRSKFSVCLPPEQRDDFFRQVESTSCSERTSAVG